MVFDFRFWFVGLGVFRDRRDYEFLGVLGLVFSWEEVGVAVEVGLGVEF